MASHRLVSYCARAGLAVVLASSVAACASSGGRSGATPSASAVASSSETPVVTTKNVTAADRDGRWTVTFKKPVISGVATAGEMNGRIDLLVDGYINEFQANDFPPPDPVYGPATLEGDYTLGVVSPTIVSVRLNVFTNLTDYADQRVSGLNMRVADGSVIRLAELFSDPTAAVPVLSEQCQTRLAGSSFAENLIWPDSVSLGDFEKGWIMTDTGLGFAFGKGEVATGAAGVVDVTIPWTEPALVGILKPTGPAGELLH